MLRNNQFMVFPTVERVARVSVTKVALSQERSDAFLPSPFSLKMSALSHQRCPLFGQDGRFVPWKTVVCWVQLRVDTRFE